MPIAAFSAVGQDQAAVEAQMREELLAQDVVTDVSEAKQVVRVDTARDPAAAEQWLDDSAEALDGWTVVVGGLDVGSSEQRRAADRKAFQNDPPADTAQEGCPAVPDGPRSTDGSTTPQLGCGSTAGVQLARGTAPVTVGGPSRTLATATDDVLAAYLPGADLPRTKVRISKGAATVDVAAGFQQALDEAEVYPGDVWQALLFTAHSNGAVDSVKFSLAGDCLAFAYATGGDTCVATDLPIELK